MNEIICYIQDYKDVNLNGILNLKKSYEMRCPSNTKLTFLYKNCSDNILNLLNGSLFSVEPIDKKYHTCASLSPYTLKVIYFFLYCKYYSKAENVFLCDATDIFINKNPFEIIKDKPCLFIENETIGKCAVNTEWIKICYNIDILNILHKKNILNGGLILGKRLDCINLLSEMCLDISGIISRIGNYRNLDQAVLNKVVYFDELNYHISINGDMINCAHLNNQSPSLNYSNNQIIINNQIPYIVHQYPCFKQLEVKW